MKRLALPIVPSIFAAPAFAHPGGVQEHEALSYIAHFALTALPILAAAALIGLAVLTYHRKAR
ncbi:MAG: hypothetical protein AAGB04_27595 [Pseudomonadota bacterium]